MAQNPTPPNFLIIQCDDLGWDDLACSGNLFVETPRLNRLAGQSVQFSQFYVNPVCAPSRATLLTGKHFLRAGVSHVHGGKDFLHLEEETLAEVLGAHGYATGMWGKWHLGHTEGYFPWQRGFDEALMMKLYRHENPAGRLNGTPVSFPGKWADEVIADHAIAWMERVKEQPFLAYVATMTPHGPLKAPAPLIDKYKTKGLSENLSTLYGMVDLLDSQLGRIFDYLETSGLAANTVVLFMSDNGPAINESLFTPTDQAIRIRSGLRGYKGDLWENGVRSPLFIRYPQRFTPAIIAQPAQLPDVFPTVLELAGVALGASQAGRNGELDGVSLSSLIETGGDTHGNRSFFNYADKGWPPSMDIPYTIFGIHDEYRPVTQQEKEYLVAVEQVISLHQGRWKLLFNPAINTGGRYPGDSVLIDLWTDPFEKINVATQYPEIHDNLYRELVQWWDRTKIEPHAFSAPVFAVSATESTDILAKAPAAIAGGLSNTVNTLYGWESADDWATFQIRFPNDSEQPVSFSVKLVWRGEIAPEGATFGVSLAHTGPFSAKEWLNLEQQDDGTYVSAPGAPLLPSDEARELTIKLIEPGESSDSASAAERIQSEDWRGYGLQKITLIPQVHP